MWPSGKEQCFQVFAKSHHSVGWNPDRDTCVLKQDTLMKWILFTPGVPARVEVDIVNEKAFGARNQV